MLAYERTAEVLGLNVRHAAQADAAQSVIQAAMAITCGLAECVALVYGNDQRTAGTAYGGPNAMGGRCTDCGHWRYPPGPACPSCLCSIWHNVTIEKRARSVTTPAIDNSVAVLRALLTEDMDTFHRLYAEQDPREHRTYAVLLTTAFYHAASKRFAQDSSPAAIIEFVSEARARIVGPEAIVPEDAKRVIRAALGEDHLIDDMDGKAYGRAQVSVLFAITHEKDDAPEEIDALLSSAADETVEYFRRREA